jgi:hypothetical protein
MMSMLHPSFSWMKPGSRCFAMVPRLSFRHLGHADALSEMGRSAVLIDGDLIKKSPVHPHGLIRQGRKSAFDASLAFGEQLAQGDLPLV